MGFKSEVVDGTPTAQLKCQDVSFYGSMIIKKEMGRKEYVKFCEDQCNTIV